MRPGAGKASDATEDVGRSELASGCNCKLAHVWPVNVLGDYLQVLFM
jgi:hypothetical protein